MEGLSVSQKPHLSAQRVGLAPKRPRARCLLRAAATSPDSASPSDLASALQLRAMDDDLVITTPSRSSSLSDRAIPGGGRAWHSEERAERSTPGGGYARAFRSQTVIVWGVDSAATPVRTLPAASPPSLLSPAVMVAAVLAGAYVAVANSFARSFASATPYKPIWKWRLVFLWPVLALISPTFRCQLRAALATSREEKGMEAGEEKGGGVEGTPQPPPPPTTPSQTGGGRTTADSSMRRPDRWTVR